MTATALRDFNTEVFGKWILVGEHAVLRGHPALVFPVKTKSLTLHYYAEETTSAHATFEGEQSTNLPLLFWGVLERGLAYTQRDRSELTGNFVLHNTIPLGTGMGASAALCVAVGRWFVHQGWINEDYLQEFARQLENLFHVESSGVDVAAAITNRGLWYQREHNPQPLTLSWQPCWYLSSTEQVAITSNCVQKVKNLWEQQPQLAARIDHDMHDSVLLAQKALQSSAEEGLPLLTQAIHKAHVCFAQWGLASGKVERHINQLLEAGALAAKPTGAGDGGFVLSLWAAPPERQLPFELFGI